MENKSCEVRTVLSLLHPTAEAFPSQRSQVRSMEWQLKATKTLPSSVWPTRSCYWKSMRDPRQVILSPKVVNPLIAQLVGNKLFMCQVPRL